MEKPARDEAHAIDAAFRLRLAATIFPAKTDAIPEAEPL
jgi:hypothetical protein